jgi:superfamily II DNA or RNA helicase
LQYQNLRDYQALAIEQIRANWQAGYKKVLLHLDTGLGKTVIFTTLMKQALEKGVPSVMAVRGRQLVNQASERLFRENTPHGVTMANHALYRPWEKAQICSIDTIRSRGIYPDARLVVVDEGHLATSEPWHEFARRYPDAYWLTVTATPYVKKPLLHLADTVIRPIEFHEAVDAGYIVDCKYYAPSMPDLTGIKIQNGDYHKGQLEERVNTSKLVGDIVDTWKRYGCNLPTVCFAVSVRHSVEIVENFNRAGIPAAHVEASTKDRERKRIIADLINGNIKIISNVGVLCTGVDIPPLGCIIGARPTRSYPLYVQQLGRGTRPFKDKNNFIYLDHSGNVLRHGFISDQPKACIDGKPKRRVDYKTTKICKQCFMAFQSAYCPQCGRIITTQKAAVGPQQVDGELVEITAELTSYLQHLKIQREIRGYKPAWIWYKLRDRYGEAVADKHYPVRNRMRTLGGDEVRKLLGKK